MREYLIDVEKQEHKEVDIESLEDYYKYIHCDYIDTYTIKIGDKYYYVFCDDEGLLKDNPIVSALDSSFEPLLVGNLLVYGKVNPEGDMLEITDDDIENIKNNIKYVALKDKEDEKLNMVLVNARD